jgi:LuxR family maltose regulon positive regulatory protein
MNHLLETKLFIPPARPGLVARPRLIERLNQGLTRKLTLISAPAGFGKTTLLAGWFQTIQRSDVHLAWISLDEGDNDAARFLAYLVAALQPVAPPLRQAMALLHSPQSPSTETILTAVINAIAGADSHFILALDDYHAVRAQAAHAALAFLIEHQPPNLHLVVATRADPPLPAARLRARGQLVELHQSDLRFTAQEAAEFLSRKMGLGLSNEEVATLATRTEGWIAGLHMAALALQLVSAPDSVTGVEQFIRHFSGSNRFILDYLAEEVLHRQPAAVQDFLLKTSILDRLSASLCDELMGDWELVNWGLGNWETELPNYQFTNLPIYQSTSLPIYQSTNYQSTSQAMLDYLERANLFVVPLDDRREWYRYHRLFADLLRQQLGLSMRGQVEGLHRRASAWYETHDFAEEAIEHALEAGDLERAAGLVEAVAETVLMNSQVVTLRRWVEALPGAQVRARPSLCVYHAWALLFSGRPLQEVEACLQEVSDERRLPPGYLAPLQAFVAIFQGQLVAAVQLARRALAELPEEDRFLRSMATWVLSLEPPLSGDAAATPHSLEQIVDLSQRVGNVMLAVMSLCNLAESYLSRGRLDLADQTYGRALDLAVDSQGEPLPASGMALMGLAEILRERNELERAEELLTAGIRRLRPWNEIGTMDGYLSLAQVRQARGDAQAADAALQHAVETAARFDVTQMDDRVVALFRVQLRLARGDLDFARDWLAQPHPFSSADAGFFEEHVRQHEHIHHARALIALGRGQEALALLQPLPPPMEREGRKRRLTQVLALTALARHTLGDQEQALRTLERAVALAEASGFVRVILDEGELIRAPLAEAARRGNAYAGRLLEAAGARAQPKPGPVAPAAAPLPEPLSERELDVLRLVAEGLPNQDIAARLFISLRTVKFHTGNIFAKLEVKNRTQAVARARELGLLPRP